MYYGTKSKNVFRYQDSNLHPIVILGQSVSLSSPIEVFLIITKYIYDYVITGS